MDRLTCTVIVCSRNRSALLADAVDSVLRADRVPDELVIVDQSDLRDEGLAARAAERGCVIRYRWDRERGVSRARNLGLATATSDILVYTDDDV